MTRFHNVNGTRIQFTAAEETARDSEIATWNAGESDRAWTAIRTKRNSLLAATDFAMISGSPYYSAQKTLWKTWRAELRDLPENITDPAAFSLDSDFPDPPFDIF